MKDKKIFSTVSQYYTVGIIAYLILAVIAIKVMNEATFQVVSSYLTSNPLLSQTSTVFVPANHVLWSIQFRWVLVLLMGLSIVVPAYYVYSISNGVKKLDLHKYRFIDWLITGSLMTLVVLALAGVQDIMTIFITVSITAMSYACLWMAIHNYGDIEKYTKKIYSIGIITTALPWLLVLVYAISTIVYGSVRSPWFVYVIFAIGLFSSAVNIYGYTWHRSQNNKKKLVSDETYPILINQFIKVLFVLILVIGLKR